MNKFLSLVLLLMIVSCSREKPSEVVSPETVKTQTQEDRGETSAHTPSSDELYSVEITPTDASRTSIIKIIPKGFKLEDTTVGWLINGKIDRNSTSSEFNANKTRKGDSVQAQIRIKNTVLFSNTIYIKNAPPELTKVKLLPEVFSPGDTLSIEAEAIDPDEDEITILYEWTKNGEPAGNGVSIEGFLKRGDKVSVKIIPFDGEDYGKPIILNREIKNMPPIIIERKDVKFDGNVYTYQVKATDPDDDPLTYSLKSSPTGMTIDNNGVIRWNVPPDFKGKTSFTVSVTDGYGGEAIQGFEVTIGVEGR